MHPKAQLEALLFAWGEPLSEKDIRQALDLTALEVRNLLTEFAEELKREDRGLRLVTIEDSYQLSTKPELFEEIATYAKRNQSKNLSNAALETLSIVAYKQPVLKSDIEDIRGVRCDQVLKSLERTELITVLGRRDIPGRPKVYGTTELFLKKFGLSSLDDLPVLEEEESEEE